MTEFKVVVTRAAHDDINGIVSYIYQFNQNAALNHLEGFESLISSLSKSPYRFKTSSHPDLKQEDIRFAQYRNYLVAFKIFEDEQLVEVYRVLYAACDIPSWLLQRGE